MKIFNVTTSKKYTKNGEEKTAWNRVGKLVYFPKTDDKAAGFSLELYMFPETKFHVFADEPKEEKLEADGIPF